MTATRISHSFCNVPVLVPQSAVLVRIYPSDGIGQPISVGQTSVIVGRDAVSQIQLDDDSVSRRHATIDWHGGSHRVIDLASTNGTYVNETKVQEACLESGDRVRFGSQIFKYLTSDEIESKYHEVVFKLMTTDGLTQVYNKRFFMDSLERELNRTNAMNSREKVTARSTDGSSELCVLIMDLDRFKQVNDTYGHLAGDAVLVEFAERASGAIRGGDILARFGGEEFALLCARTSMSDAILMAERLRETIEEAPFIFGDLKIPVTVSIGVASTQGPPCHSSQSIIQRADEQLYVAKHNGRNQVHFEGKQL